jgi:hypothetical protein
VEGKGEQWFPEAAQEVLDDTADDVDVTDLIQLGVTTCAKETITELLDSLIVTGRGQIEQNRYGSMAYTL